MFSPSAFPIAAAVLRLRVLTQGAQDLGPRPDPFGPPQQTVNRTLRAMAAPVLPVGVRASDRASEVGE
jgi:hypothetical protein